MSISRNKLTEIINTGKNSNYIKHNKLNYANKTRCLRSNSQQNIKEPSHFLGVSEGLISCPIVIPYKQSSSTISIHSQSETNTKHKRLLSSIINITKLERRFNHHANIFNPKNDLVNEALTQIENQLRNINEIKKLNKWDVQHAHIEKLDTAPKTEVKYKNTLDDAAMKFMLDLKNNTKHNELFNRNESIKNAVSNIAIEQKTIVKQNMNINRKTINIEMLSGGKMYSNKEENANYSQVEYYKKVMREKIKLEEMITNNLMVLSQELYNKKTKKKLILIEEQKVIQVIASLTEQINQLMNEDYRVKAILNKMMSKEIKQTTELKRISTQKRNSLIFAKTVDLLTKKNSKKEEINKQCERLNKEKQRSAKYLESLNNELIDLEREIRQFKLQINNCVNEFQRYLIEILKKGIDVRRNGLSWVIVKLIQLKTFLERSDFPKILTNDQIDYLMTISYLLLELNELVQLLKVLKLRQKKMKDKHDEVKGKLKGSNSVPCLIIDINLNKPKRLEELFLELDVISKKYEQISQVSIDSKQEEIYINNIIGNLKEKIKENIGKNGNSKFKKDKSDGLYFLPGSLSEYYNENHGFRQYFDDIFYLNNEINKKDVYIKEYRQKQINAFRKKHGENLSEMNEMIYVALFGNGIII